MTEMTELRYGRVITDKFVVDSSDHKHPERVWKYYDGGTESEEISINTFNRLKKEGWREEDYD